MTEPLLDGNEMAYVTDCICSGWVSSRGSYVERFERAVANWCGVRHAVATASGTGALHLALLALDIGPGDEVILPTLSYVAPANVIVYTGARPIFVDADPVTWNLDLEQVKSKITPRTRAVLPVHLYGHPVNMDRLMALAEEHALEVVEDACEAHGSECRGRLAGSMGHVGCFSFYGNKLITTGEGGMAVTDDEDIAQTIRLLRNQSKVGDGYWHSRIGFSYRMTSLQAAIGLAQLEQVDRWIAARRWVAQQYDELLQDVAGLRFHQEPNWARSVPWLYSVLVEAEAFGMGRDGLIDCLAEHGIESKPFFIPLHHLPAYREDRSYPVAEGLAQRGINLPTSATLKREQIEYIAQVIRKAAMVG